MRTSHDIRKKASALSEADKKTLLTLIEELKFVIDHPQINEDMLTKLGNISTTINTFRENYMWRILRAAKQNHMLD